MTQSARRSGKSDSGAKIEVRNVNVPGWSAKVDAAKYEAMKVALLTILPKKSPGLTQTEMRHKVVFVVSQELFPGGEKTDWWSKCVQLDLESRGVIVRETASKPLRWHRA
jgi:hypothetical protein